MISPEEAAAIAHVGVRTIYRWVEAGKLHFMEKSEQMVLVCLNSLLRNANSVIPRALNQER
jgi:predicted site-specific integrase-resolvase